MGEPITIIGQNSVPVDADRVSKSLKVIQRAHAETHDGDLYEAAVIFTAVADAGVKWVVWNVPSGVYPHLSYDISTTGNCTVELVEGLTYSGGTMVTAYNRNQNYPNKDNVFYHTPTSPTGGTSKFPWLIPAGGKHGGAGSSDFPEKIFKPVTKYGIKVTNISGGAASFSISIIYYESLIV